MTNVKISNIPCSELTTIDSFFDSFVEKYPDYRKWLKEACFDRRCILAKDDMGEIIGLLIYGFKLSDRYGMNGNSKRPIVKICSLKVREDFRRKYLATEMVRSIENHYSSTQSKWMYITVYPECTDMIGFLDHLGFIRHDRLKERTGEYVYKKRIHS